MGKIVHESEEEGMDVEEVLQEGQRAAPSAKKKAIKKKDRQSKQALQSSQGAKKAARIQQSISGAIVRRVAKKVNLVKKQLSLQEKQVIFNKVVATLANKKKISRKERKKQSYLIKKELRKEIDQRIPVKPLAAGRSQDIQEQVSVGEKKVKFEKEKAILAFKSTMGIGFASIKQRLIGSSTITGKR